MIALVNIQEDSKGRSRARILLDNAENPVDYFFSGCRDLLMFKVQQDYDAVSFVRKLQFDCEVDHIMLFGCRSHAQCWTAPAPM